MIASTIPFAIEGIIEISNIENILNTVIFNISFGKASLNFFIEILNFLSWSKSFKKPIKAIINNGTEIIPVL